MNDIQLLTRLREDVPAASPAQLAAPRRRVMAQIRSAPPPAHRRRPGRPAWFAAVGVAAAAAVLLTSTAGLPPFSSSSSAADTLRHAADALTASAGAQPGQYVKVTRNEESLSFVEVPGPTWGAYVERSVIETFVPADLDQMWVRREYTRPADTFYGGAAVRSAARSAQASLATSDRPRLERAGEGRFGNGDLGGDGDALLLADLPGLPRDPQQLLALLKSKPYAAEMNWQESVMRQVATLLDSGLTPADLQKSLYQALALLPDVVVVADQQSLDGRTGTAVGVDLTSGPIRDQVLIDESTGDYLGQRQLQTAAVGAVPAGTVMSATSVDATVVDSAP